MRIPVHQRCTFKREERAYNLQQISNGLLQLVNLTRDFPLDVIECLAHVFAESKRLAEALVLCYKAASLS